MSTIVRSREPRGRGTPLTGRAVRVRNFYVRAIARKRGLREPADAELSSLLPDVTLSAAVLWWEEVQREEGASPHGGYGDPLATARSHMMLKALAISAMIIFALLAFPGEIAGSGANASI